MAGPIIFVAFQVFLFGITNAHCPTPCNGAKIFADGVMCGTNPPINCNGTWHLKDPCCYNCLQEWGGEEVPVCKYRRNSDGKYMCFCDPGNIPYEDGKDWVDGLCYDNTNTHKLLTFIGNYPANSYDVCMAACIEANTDYTYFGLEDGDECFCGYTQPPTPTHEQVFRCDCNISCPGEILKTCGGPNKIQVYAIPEPYPETEEELCYNTNPFTFIGNLPFNSQADCMAACIAADPGYTYFGLEDGVECWCGTQPPTTGQVFRCDCNTPCPGAPLTTCGGTNLIQVSAIY